MNKKLFISTLVLFTGVVVIGIMPLVASAQVAPVPTVTSMSPMSTAAGSANTTISVYGTNFVPGSTVEFNGLPIYTAYESANELSATIPSSVLTTAITDAVQVLNPDGTWSYLPSSLIFTITPTTMTILTTPGLPDTGFDPSNGVGF